VPLSTHALVKAYRQNADKQKLVIQKANATRNKMLFVTEALRKLLADEHFVTLLRAEGIETLPQPLAERIGNEGMLTL
jgi:ParB family transcriptional regulator, chromosome partitioning protein